MTYLEFAKRGDLIEKVVDTLGDEYKKKGIRTYEQAMTLANEKFVELGANFDDATNMALDAWEKFISDYNLFACDICGEIKDGDDAISLTADDTEKRLEDALDRESTLYGADCFTGERVNMAECICPECRSIYLILDYSHRLETAMRVGDIAGVVEVEKESLKDLQERLDADDAELIRRLFVALENRKKSEKV